MKRIPILILISSTLLISRGVGQERPVVIDFDKTADSKMLDVSQTGSLVAN